MSTALRRRLQRLEAALVKVPRAVAQTRSNEILQRAIRILWDVLEQHYPNETPPAGVERRHSVFFEKVRAAAARIQSGAPSETDLAAIAAMPRDELRIFGRRSAEDFIIWFAEAMATEPTPEQHEEVQRYLATGRAS